MKPANWSRLTAQKAITKLLDHTNHSTCCGMNMAF